MKGLRSGLSFSVGIIILLTGFSLTRRKIWPHCPSHLQVYLLHVRYHMLFIFSLLFTFTVATVLIRINAFICDPFVEFYEVSSRSQCCTEILFLSIPPLTQTSQQLYPPPLNAFFDRCFTNLNILCRQL